MDIAVYGGSFSPVHYGHLAVASGVIDNSLADEVWMLPCRRNPLKDVDPVWADETRLDMLGKATEYWEKKHENKKLKVSCIELTMPSPSFSYNTFRCLMEKYPDLNFRLVVGADSYLDFQKWYEWEWLESNLRPIVYPRPGFLLKEVRPGWTLLEGVETVDISSTEIRKMIEENKPVVHWMPWLEDKDPIYYGKS